MTAMPMPPNKVAMKEVIEWTIKELSVDDFGEQVLLTQAFEAWRKSYSPHEVGTEVSKHFDGYGWFRGTIEDWCLLSRTPWVPAYHILYEDGDSEWLDDSTTTTLVENAKSMDSIKTGTKRPLVWETEQNSVWVTERYDDRKRRITRCYLDV